VADETNVLEERDMVAHYLRKRAVVWRALPDTDISVATAGELDDIADEVEAGKHWGLDE
jgi:hypothetical protein